jgi:hypothetical protein
VRFCTPSLWHLKEPFRGSGGRPGWGWKRETQTRKVVPGPCVSAPLGIANRPPCDVRSSCLSHAPCHLARQLDHFCADLLALGQAPPEIMRRTRCSCCCGVRSDFERRVIRGLAEHRTRSPAHRQHVVDRCQAEAAPWAGLRARRRGSSCLSACRYCRLVVQTPAAQRHAAHPVQTGAAVAQVLCMWLPSCGTSQARTPCVRRPPRGGVSRSNNFAHTDRWKSPGQSP